MTNKFCILFAGPAGSSKTPITNYLSCLLKIPVFNKDAIRTEVREDLLQSNEEEVQKRARERLEIIISEETSFIFDSSIDRSWPQIKERLSDNDYKFFVISLDFTKELLTKIYKAKEYTQFGFLDKWIGDHDTFLQNYSEDISLHLTDIEFPSRLSICLEKVSEWLSNYHFK